MKNNFAQASIPAQAGIYALDCPRIYCINSGNDGKKKGFTLVELSIVLVIIGLLIGGVLVGQSLIESAKVSRFASDLRQYEIAVTQFYGKFKQYPGDSSFFTPPGNNNGAIAWGVNGNNQCAAAPNGTLSNREYTQVWGHLSQSGMLSKNYPAFSPANGGFYGNCGGVHSGKDLESGKFWPHTDLSSKAAATAYFGGFQTRIIHIRKLSATANMLFFLGVNSEQVIPLEKKFGAAAYDYSDTQVGLVNIAGPVGICYDIDDSAGSGDYYASCNSPHTEFGNLRYFIPPQ